MYVFLSSFHDSVPYNCRPILLIWKMVSWTLSVVLGYSVTFEILLKIEILLKSWSNFASVDEMDKPHIQPRCSIFILCDAG